jgi:hypothetical protein
MAQTHTITLTRLRRELFTVADTVLATGVPVVIERNGQRLRLIADSVKPKKKKSKLDNLVPHPEAMVYPDELLPSAWELEGKAEWEAELDEFFPRA